LQGGEQEVSLRKELSFLQHYLDIQHTRFQDRLTFVQDVAPDTLDAMVPSLILQPLVENAVRHGIEPRSTPGQIVIHAHRDNGRLLLEVRDNGPGAQPSRTTGCAGIGLSNTRARLEQLYGAGHRFLFENLPEGGVRVRMELPFRPAVTTTPVPADA
jgi:LytS/YehU family sensor histidine kinase